MKKLGYMCMAVLLLGLLLAGCSAAGEPAATPTITPTATPAAVPTATPTTEPTASPTDPPAATAEPTAAPTEAPAPMPTEPAAILPPDIEDAKSYIGGSAGELAEALGEPLSRSYASSCIGDGEDGQWDYGAFTVYTYRAPDGGETVEDVFA